VILATGLELLIQRMVVGVIIDDDDDDDGMSYLFGSFYSVSLLLEAVGCGGMIHFAR